MIIIPTPRAFLGPLPFIIFPANFLPDYWIGHIEKSEEKTAEVGEMGDASSCTFGGGEEGDEAEDDHHIFGRYGEKEIDVDGTVRKEPAKG